MLKHLISRDRSELSKNFCWDGRMFSFSSTQLNRLQWETLTFLTSHRLAMGFGADCAKLHLSGRNKIRRIKLSMFYTTLHSLNLQEPFKYNLMCVFTFLERAGLVKGFIYLVKRAQDWLGLMLNLDTLSTMKYASRTRAFWSLQAALNGNVLRKRTHLGIFDVQLKFRRSRRIANK